MVEVCVASLSSVHLASLSPCSFPRQAPFKLSVHRVLSSRFVFSFSSLFLPNAIGITASSAFVFHHTCICTQEAPQMPNPYHAPSQLVRRSRCRLFPMLFTSGSYIYHVFFCLFLSGCVCVFFFFFFANSLSHPCVLFRARGGRRVIFIICYLLRALVAQAKPDGWRDVISGCSLLPGTR